MRLLKARTDAFVDKMIQNPVYNAAAYLERCEATGVIAGLTLPQVTRVAEEQPADGAAVVKELEHPKN